MNDRRDENLVTIEKGPPRPFTLFLMTILAWLGLSGLVDNMLDWKDWFEFGVMEHWRSAKQWLIAIAFDWLPFRVRPWLIDYMIIGAITFRSMPKSRWTQSAEFRAIQPEWALKADLVLSELFIALPKKFIAAMLWPVIIVNAFLAEIIDYGPDVEAYVVENWRSGNRLLLLRLIWYTTSFIPFLFLVSELLYEFG